MTGTEVMEVPDFSTPAQTNTKVQWTLSHGVAYRHVVDRGKHVPQD
jgi:hypothetical protein